MFVLIGQAAAQDGVAPVTSLATNDLLLSQATVDALANVDPAPALDLTDLQDLVYTYQPGTPPTWATVTGNVAAAIGSGANSTAGIAITAASITGGAYGHWEYRAGIAAAWSPLDLSAVEEDAAAPSSSLAYLLTMVDVGDAAQLRFVPDADATDGTATLTFRVWDGSDGATPRSLGSTQNTDLFAAQLFGGSPTAYSAETRTLTVQVLAANDAPSLNSEPSNPSAIAYIPITVRDLLLTSSPFTDADGDDLGLAITDFDNVDAGWEYSDDGGSTWSSLLDEQPGVESSEAFLLGPDVLLRYSGAAGQGLLSLHAWDQTSGGSLVTQAIDDSVSSDYLGVDVSNNSAPSIEFSIEGLDGNGALHVRRGTPATFTANASDPDSDDVLAWSAATGGYSGGGTVSVDPVQADWTEATYSDNGYDNSDTITLTITDLAGNQDYRQIPVVISDNNAPTVSVLGQQTLTVTLGSGATQIDLGSSDADNDTLYWSSIATNYGTLGFDASSTAADGGNLLSYTPTQVGVETVTVTVDDSYGGTNVIVLTITVLPATNQAPSIDQVSNGNFAIVGQPFEMVVRASDPNATDLPLLTISTSESDVTASKLADGLWQLRWVPTIESSEHGVTVTVTDPGALSDSSQIYLDYVAAPAPAVLSASIPSSTPGNIVYGALAPGYQGGFTLLSTFLAGQPRSVARAFWWTGAGYAELPGTTVSDPLRTGVFLASTVAPDLTFAPPTQPAPFAITLRAGQWTFFGIPPLLLSSSGGNVTSHLWSEIELQEPDGTAVDLSTKLAAIGPLSGGSSDADTEPFAYRWDLTPASYQRTDTVQSGTGYWIRNRSGQDYRLVRLTAQVGGGQPASTLRFAATKLVPTAIASIDQPPAPPAGSSVSSAADGGGHGGCGTGGLAGLLLAGLALIGLRPRRRV